MGLSRWKLLYPVPHCHSLFYFLLPLWIMMEVTLQNGIYQIFIGVIMPLYNGNRVICLSCLPAVWNLSLLYLSLWGPSGHVLWTWVLQSLLGGVQSSVFVCMGIFLRPSVWYRTSAFECRFLKCVFFSQVPQREDSGGWCTQYFLPGVRVLPVGARACDRECGFQRDGPAVPTVRH